MFENIIGQKETVGTLTAELAAGSFPRAALFFGPPYSGKLSTAMEVARVLTCARGGSEWACDCSSCRLQRELSHPHTVFLGFRYSEVEIAASADALRRNPKPSTQYLFLRAVRKLLRRFDPTVWDTDESRMKSAGERISAIEEMLQELTPGKSIPVDSEATLEKVIEECVALSSVVKNDHISIGQVRKLAAWAHLTASDSLKVALIENADRMQESARNALLKLLEEPPSGVCLILLSTRRSAIIPTVLSRLRPYGFLPRSNSEEKEVLSKIFRDDTGRYSGLRSFFLAWKEISSEELARICRRFLQRVTEVDGAWGDVLEDLAELFKGRGPREKEAVMSFFEELTFFMQCGLREASVGIDALEEWNGALREAQFRMDSLNMSPQVTVEGLFHRMRRAVISVRGPERRAET
jgi:DNA polymerase III delta prime subunit